MDNVYGYPKWRKSFAQVGQLFEFVVFDENADEKERQIIQLKGDSSARSKAGRLAKANGGPVDLAYAGNADWPDRYITTALPSSFHSSGFSFERLI